MDRNKALDRIRKCLALAGSPNANEAAVAMRQAQKLMEEFGVDLAEAHAPKIDSFGMKAASKTGTGWEGQVAIIVADALGVEVYRDRVAVRVLGAARFVYYGRAERVALAEYAHANLRRAVEKGRRAFVRGLKAEYPFIKTSQLRSEGNGFAYGFVSEVKKSVQSLVIGPEEMAAIDKWKGERGLVLRSRRGRRGSVSATGYNAGKDAGASYGMNRPINGAGGVAGLIGR